MEAREGKGKAWRGTRGLQHKLAFTLVGCMVDGALACCLYQGTFEIAMTALDQPFDRWTARWRLSVGVYLRGSWSDHETVGLSRLQSFQCRDSARR